MLVLIAILIFPPISNVLISTPVHFLLGLLFVFSNWIGSLLS